MIPFPREQVRESIPVGPVGGDERGGRKPTHPALILLPCNSYLGDSPYLFCAPPSHDPADDRMGGEKSVKMG